MRLRLLREKMEELNEIYSRPTLGGGNTRGTLRSTFAWPTLGTSDEPVPIGISGSREEPSIRDR